MKRIKHFFTNEKVVPLLLTTALVLGVAIFIKEKPGSYSSPTTENKVLVQSSALADAKLTKEEKALFYSPGKDATREQIQAFSSLVAQKAILGDTILIKDCTASPTVLKVKIGSTFYVDNKGKSDINFGFRDERTLVKSGSKQKIKADFANGHGIYGYGCDDPTLTRSIGVLFITQ